MEAVLEAGACFGESALVGERCRLVTVQAEEKSLLLQLRASDFRAANLDLNELKVTAAPEALLLVL